MSDPKAILIFPVSAMCISDSGLQAQTVPGTSWDCPSIPGILGYSDSRVYTYMVPGTSWDHPSIPGILGYSDSGVYTHMIPGTSWYCLSIPGFQGYSDIGVLALVVLGTSWDRPSILGFLGYSDSGGLYTYGPRNTLGSSEYPGNPGILRQWASCTDVPRNILGYSDSGVYTHVHMVPGTSLDHPSILGFLGYSDSWGSIHIWSQEHLGIVRVSRDT